MSLWSKIRGTAELLFQIGLGGPQVKNNAGNIEARNAGDSGFVIVRGASPVGDNDLTTKQYVDQVNKPIVVQNQFNGNSALPSNTATEQWYVVTTTGPNASIGQLLWDDGSNTGTVQVVVALEGRSIFTTQAFTTGTISLLANSYYVWDTVSSSWLLEANPAFAGAVREIRMAINNAASQSSATFIPANAVVCSAELDIQTPYSGGATISVGQTGLPSLVMGTGDNLATVAGLYQVMQDTPWGASALAVLVTVSGAPSAGAGFCVVRYSVPNN